MTETNAEWSAIDFLRQTVARENGFTTTFIDAIEEVTVQAERVQELESQIERHKAEKYEAFKKNDIYREALEYYAKFDVYYLDGDVQETARQALEGSPHE